MGLDMYYFKAKKGEPIESVAIGKAEPLGYMRKFDPAFDYYQELTQANEPQSVIQVYRHEVQTLINGSEEFLEKHPEIVNDEKCASGIQQLKNAITESQKALDNYNEDEENLFVVSYW